MKKAKTKSVQSPGAVADESKKTGKGKKPVVQLEASKEKAKAKEGKRLTRLLLVKQVGDDAISRQAIQLYKTLGSLRG